MGIIKPDTDQGENKRMAAEEVVLWGGKGGRPSVVGLLSGLGLTMVSAQNPVA